MTRKARRLRFYKKGLFIKSKKHSLINKDSKILTIGSCFALELRKWLTNNGYNAFEQDKYELIWYNTYTILYEFARIVNKWKQKDKDIWQLSDGRWQDPYRRCVFSDTKIELLLEIRRLDNILGEAIKSSNVIIITLGLTEVFVKRDGNVICGVPGYCGGGGHDCSFLASNYVQNYENIKKVVEYLAEVNPTCNLVLTVSPVPFFATFRELDHLVANTASKSILRAVADEITKNCNNVYYFHSYEMVACEDRQNVYKPDGRHIRSSYVKKIMGEFERFFIEK